MAEESIQSGATVDITEENPRPAPNQEHFTQAVAVQYDKESDDAPRVTASGRGAVAEKILEIAFAQGIRVREDADLVEVLSKVEVDSPIPLEAFAAVAEILAYVYKANAYMASKKGQ